MDLDKEKNFHPQEIIFTFSKFEELEVEDLRRQDINTVLNVLLVLPIRIKILPQCLILIFNINLYYMSYLSKTLILIRHHNQKYLKKVNLNFVQLYFFLEDDMNLALDQ